MDEASVKEIFKQKLPQLLTQTWLEDSDIVDLVLLMGYRLYLEKCDKDQVQSILSQAITDPGVVDGLVRYFDDFAEENKKKAALQKHEAEKRQQESKVEQNNIKKQESNIKTKPKQIYKPKPKLEPKAEGELQEGVQVPNPQKRPKLEGENQQEPKQGQQQIPLATQLINQGKVKCKYFPFCKNQSCEYFHPTEKCPFFPRCKFGQSCMYVHESCKYAQNCTRANCFYDHPFKKKSDNPMLEFMKMAMGQMKGINKRPIRKRKPTEDNVNSEKTPTPKTNEQK